MERPVSLHLPGWAVTGWWEKSRRLSAWSPGPGLHCSPSKDSWASCFLAVSVPLAALYNSYLQNYIYTLHWLSLKLTSFYAPISYTAITSLLYLYNYIYNYAYNHIHIISSTVKSIQLYLIRWRTEKPAHAAVHGVAKSRTQLSDWTTRSRFILFVISNISTECLLLQWGLTGWWCG